MKRTLFILMTCLILLICAPVGALASQTQDVYLTASDTLDAALSQVIDGGTIHVEGTVTVASGFTWSDHGKTVTITGGTLDFSALSTVTIRDNVQFEDITLTFASGATVYAGGKSVTIAQTVTLTNPVTLYGGTNGGTIVSTDLTVLAGTYNKIYGGSKGGTVSGDTHLLVGGTVNSTIDETDHCGTNNVYGGSYQGTVKGSAHLTFTGSAKAHYVYGGNHSSGTVAGGTVAVFSGGKAMHLSGGSHGTDHQGDVDLTVIGGQLEQIFGGCNGSALTGDVTVRVLGGTVTRRVYGGCYNETSGLSFSTARYVTGNVTLIIGGGANISFTSSNSDRSIYAHSRHKTLSSTEITQIVFADAAAYNSYKSKLGAQDFAMKLIMGSASAADSTHYYTYTASGAVISQACAYHSTESDTATLSLDSTVSLVYTGKDIAPCNVTVSSGWFGDVPVISYSNNVNAGTATATATRVDVSAALQFTIAPAPQNAPVLGKSDETVKGKADGRITGLTTAMEYSTDGIGYSPVTDPDMLLAAGTYFVRNAEKTNYTASPAASVTIGQGRLLKVTFRAEGSGDVVKELAWNETLVDIPDVPARVGYDHTAPVWNVTDFSNIQSDMTVTAVYTVNTYKVTYIADGETVDEQTVEYGQNAAAPAIPTKEGYDKTAPYWDKDGKNVTSDLTVTAVYTVNTYKVTYIADGETVNEQTVEYGQNAAAPAIPTKEGYDKTAPYWDKDGKNVTSDLTVTAVYTVNTYKVTYIVDGETVNKQTVEYGQNAAAPAIPTKEGYDKTAPYWDKSGESITADTIINAIYVENPSFPVGWNWIDGKWYFYDEAGRILCSQWIQDSVGWCYVGEEGYMLTNAWVPDSVGMCYVGSGGYIVTNGWVCDEGGWFYMDGSGRMVTRCWKRDSVGWCYLGSDGRMVTNAWVRDSIGWCYVGADGYCLTNTWKADSVGWCYLNSEGSMTKNAWVQTGGKWYFLNADGYMVANKWMKDSVGWVYLGSDGAMVTNKWVMDSVGWCYVGADGYAVTNCWKQDNVGWCYLNSEGSMTKNAWVQTNGKWYYCDGNGYMVTNCWKWIGGYEYYFYTDGHMAANERIDGYYVDASGKYIPGK